MAIALEDIQQKIDDETAQCVERKRNKPFFQFTWMRSRQSFEPGCRSEVTAKYQNDLTAAQEEKYKQESDLFREFQQQASGEIDKKTMMLVGGTFLFMLLMVLLID